MSEIAQPLPQQPQSVQRWETEIPLLILMIIASLAMWAAVILSLIGVFYAVFFGIFFFLVHVGFIAHLRGSAVKLGPDQLPDLYARVQTVAQRLGMEKMPDAYVMQAGGALNALATKLLGSNFIVLFTDLLDACEDDQEAADFIIAHELGHLKAGHLRFQWFLILGRLVPFLGGAYSRACEYTADRYGFAAVTNRRSGIHGLTVLAAGGKRAKVVNLQTFVEQRRDMTGVLMTLGRWMSTHPPICDRVAEADRNLGGMRPDATKGILGALALIAFAFLAPTIGGGWFFMKFMKKVQEQTAAFQTGTATMPSQASVLPSVPTEEQTKMAEQAKKDLQRLADVARKYREKNGSWPADVNALYAALPELDPEAGELVDPFDGEWYAYTASPTGVSIWSTGNEMERFAGQLEVRVE